MYCNKYFTKKSNNYYEYFSFVLFFKNIYFYHVFDLAILSNRPRSNKIFMRLSMELTNEHNHTLEISDTGEEVRCSEICSKSKNS